MGSHGGGGGGGGVGGGGVAGGGGGGGPSMPSPTQFAPQPLQGQAPALAGAGPNITVKLISELGEVSEGKLQETAELLLTLLAEKGQRSGIKLPADMISTDEDT